MGFLLYLIGMDDEASPRFVAAKELLPKCISISYGQVFHRPGIAFDNNKLIGLSLHDLSELNF